MVKSWDFWDTLVTRCVYRPVDLFEIVEVHSGVVGFALARVEAETKSRIGVAETSLTRIYEFIPYPEEQRERLKALELDAELILASPVGINTSSFKENDYVISDMYLDRDTMLQIALKCGVRVLPENMFVSTAFNATKDKGDLFDVVKKVADLSAHEGDNHRSDVQIPSLKGIASTHFTGVYPRKLETYWNAVKGDGKYMAGILRAARLANTVKQKQPEWDLYAQIVAPVLVQFVEWIFSDASSRGINKIFFLARDGQILFRIAKKLCEARNLDFECSYLFASRQALHLPGHMSVNESAEWLLDDTSTLTLRMVAARADLDLDAFFRVCSPSMNVDVDHNLSQEQRRMLCSIIRSPEVEKLIDSAAKKALEVALAYLTQEKVITERNVPFAVVDVGWNARLQRSLENILVKAGCSVEHIHGYYLGVSKKCVYKTGDRVHGYIFDPFDREKEKANWLDSYRGIMEFFLSADHPSVNSYTRDRNGQVGPLFLNPVAENEIKDIRFRQEAILSFTDRYCAVSKLLQRCLHAQSSVAIRMLRNLFERPSLAEARVFEGCVITEQQVESDFVPLVRKLRYSEIFMKRSRNVHGMWAEGSHALTGSLWLYRARALLSVAKAQFIARLQ